jgi:hypothetical protein
MLLHWYQAGKRPDQTARARRGVLAVARAEQDRYPRTPQSDGWRRSPAGRCEVAALARMLTAVTSAGRRLGYRSGTARVLRALVTPVLAEFAVVESAQHMRVVIQPVGGALHLLKSWP